MVCIKITKRRTVKNYLVKTKILYLDVMVTGYFARNANMNILGGTLVAVGVNEMQCTDLCLGKVYF